MRIRFSAILPALGLLLFALVTYRSMRVNAQGPDGPHKYYWWSSLRLDTDPQNQGARPTNPCQDQQQNCTDWKPAHLDIAPGGLEKSLVYTALPAFLAGSGLVIALSKLGVNEVLTFMVCMPILLFLWLYFAGWLLDRLIFRLMLPKNTAPLKLT